MAKTATLTIQQWGNSLAVRIPKRAPDGVFLAACEQLNQIISIGA